MLSELGGTVVVERSIPPPRMLRVHAGTSDCGYRGVFLARSSATPTDRNQRQGLQSPPPEATQIRQGGPAPRLPAYWEVVREDRLPACLPQVAP